MWTNGFNNKQTHIHTQRHTLTSLSRPEFDSVSLVPAAALWSVTGESVFGTETIVPSSDTWDFSVSLSIPIEEKQDQPQEASLKGTVCGILHFYIFNKFY